MTKITSKISYLLVLCIAIGAACSQSKSPEVAMSEKVPQESPKGDIPKSVPKAEILDLTGEVPQFVVIAGSYSSLEAAQSKVRKLRALGFQYADVIQRKDSELHFSVAERFDSEEAADSFSKKLKTDYEIKSYVYELNLE
ncbi:MAG: SPOR domain-containing protein [Bacteroidia bacterium]|nr:SPOR domain-containing protein [Bacteroidia bacterium]